MFLEHLIVEGVGHECVGGWIGNLLKVPELLRGVEEDWQQGAINESDIVSQLN